MQLSLPARFSDLKLRHLQVLELEQDPIRRVHGVTGMPVSELRKMPTPLVMGADDHLSKILTQEISTHKKVVTLKGVDYGFVPDWEKFTAGEWIDMELYCEDFWKTAHKAMSVLYRPIVRKYKDTYTIEPYTAEEDAEVFKDLPAPVVSGALLFFWTTETELLNSLRRSLMQQNLRLLNLQKNGDGTQPFTRSLTKTSWTSRLSPNSLWVTSLHIWRSCKTWIFKGKKH